MKRYRLRLEYDGGGFSGWQRQKNQQILSVQGVLETALAIAYKQQVFVHGAGRTDAGVHARAMMAHVDIAHVPSPLKLRESLNALVRPYPLAVLDVDQVSDSWHARFSCTRRTYVYRILNRRADPVLEKGKVWWVQDRLDEQAMHTAAQKLLGKHDFSSFQAAECQAQSAIKTLDRLDVSRCGDIVAFETTARSFLYHQVRNMVGTLVQVGRGKWSIDQLDSALKACSRSAAGPTAPPQGLYFMQAVYDQ